MFESYDPGVRSRFTRNPSYWKPNAAHVDAVEVIVINDIAARTNAMMSGQVHAINQLDFKTVDLLRRNPNLNIVQSAGGQHFTFLMDCTQAPYTDNNIRLAIKHAIDREQLLKTALRGTVASAMTIRSQVPTAFMPPICRSGPMIRRSRSSI